MKIWETEAKSIPLTHIHDCLLSWLGTKYYYMMNMLITFELCNFTCEVEKIIMTWNYCLNMVTWTLLHRMLFWVVVLGIQVCIGLKGSVKKIEEWVSGFWCLMPLSTIFQNIVAVSFIGGGNQSTQRKPPTCRKSFYHIMLYRVHLTMNKVRTHDRGVMLILFIEEKW